MDELTMPATQVKSVDILDGQVLLMTDGSIGKYRHFSLGAPPRLVVDLYDIEPGSAEKAYSLSGAFKGLRVGRYPTKSRFVFDATGEKLPEYSVSSTGQAVQVVWDQKPIVGENTPPSQEGVQVTIEAIDFIAEGGQSVLTLQLSNPATLVDPVIDGDIVRFGVENAAINRSLRRVVDPSSFPSAIRLVTPYTVFANGIQDVRFAVELKGPVSYRLEKQGSLVKFIVDDGPFAEIQPASVVTKKVPVAMTTTGPELSMENQSKADGTVGVTDGKTSFAPVAGTFVPTGESQAVAFTGQKISLVFDDAEIRNILQLIAEVSDLNIIASDDVKGTITLRLVDVPWDQALKLIMDIKELGMLREGNIARIMPKDQIRKMQQEQFVASRALEKMEDLVSEVIAINYTDVESVASKSKTRLTERGSIIEDVRDKKLIVTDVPSAVASIKKLAALLDTPERQVLIEARIVEAESTFSRELGVNWGVSYDDDPTGTAGVAGTTGLGGDFALFPANVAAGASSGFASDFTFGRVGLDKLVLDLRLAAVEKANLGRIISSPRITTLNGEEGEIRQGREIPYTTVSEDGTKTEFKKAELSLKVTPEINADGSIFLEIEAKNDAPLLENGVLAISTKQAETRALVQDGETTVIGGIFIEDTQASDSGVPWLQHIPILGNLFKSQLDSTDRRELLIFITPRILD
ncbi:type IV pilus secretin family protein [Syntrophotalea acetylenivorans]|uniref:type IV pilus secretin family protein n=1 Tax=Syntrophotalea acetylenivorans TaxID=1842532 RepID=UPI00131403BC|nr:type IV pilus secretin family protein [Syntrophotalea acetylenivorans]